MMQRHSRSQPWVTRKKHSQAWKGRGSENYEQIVQTEEIIVLASARRGPVKVPLHQLSHAKNTLVIMTAVEEAKENRRDGKKKNMYIHTYLLRDGGCLWDLFIRSETFPVTSILCA